LGAPTFKICGFYNEKQRFLEKHFANSSIVASMLALFLGCFLMKNHVFSISIFALIFDRLFGRKNINNATKTSRGAHPFWLLFSTLAPKPIFGCILIACGLPFGVLLPPFGAPWLLSGSLWRPLAPFYLPLATLGCLFG
jgi:hypothetical protein